MFVSLELVWALLSLVIGIRVRQNFAIFLIISGVGFTLAYVGSSESGNWD